MTTTLTISAPLAMAAVPGLIAIGGVVVGIALNGWLSTGIEVARLNASNDDKTARWLWRNGYRKTPHAGPDITPELPAADPHVTGELLAVDGVDTETDAPHEDTDRAGMWRAIGRILLVAAVVPPLFVWQWCVVLPLEWVRDAVYDWRQMRRERDQVGSGDRPTRDEVIVDTVRSLRSSGHSDADVAAELKDLFGLGLEPWTLYDEDELRADGMGEVEILLMREGIVLVPDDGIEVCEDFEQTVMRARDTVLTEPRAELESAAEIATPEPVQIVRVNHRYRRPGDTGLFPLVKVVGDKAAGRHRLVPEPEMPAINQTIPAQRTDGDL